MNQPRSQHRARIVQGAVAVAIVAVAAVWLNRWWLSRSAVTVVDPMVRAWAADQVSKASDGAYHLASSTIKVDNTRRRLSIDSILLVTDSAANSRLTRPYPVVSVRFHGCEITGIDLTRLASRGGLHATHAGCDTVFLTLRTLVPPAPGAARAKATGADSNSFLRFQGKIDLPSLLPFVSADTVAFPHVQVAFDLLATDGRRSTLAVDSVSVLLDSVRIDRRERVAKRRPLFSRNIRVKLDRFTGTTKAGDRISLDHLDLNLEDGTGRLDALVYERFPGERVDSTGLVLAQARHIALDGVDWRTFLLTGDIAIGSLRVDSAAIRMVAPRNPPRFVGQAVTGTIAGALRSPGREIVVDTIDVRGIHAVQVSRKPFDSVTTTIRELALAHVDVGVGDSLWRQPFPIGHITLAAIGLYRHTRGMDMAFSQLRLDAGAQRIALDSFRMAPQGDDSAFERRQKYQEVRVSMALPRVEGSGIDLPALLLRGALRVRRLDAHDFAIDVMADNHKPDDPGPHQIRRSPQQVLRDGNTELAVDTLLADGGVTYRNRGEDAANAGTLSFRSVQLHGYNFGTDPARMTAATPFRLIGDAKLMGAGAMHVEWDVPLLAPDFSMTWSGSLASMDPAALNPFLVDAVGMRFVAGEFQSAQWNATVTHGQSRGKLSPRWKGMKVELPGVARQHTGILGGVMRGMAKLAANTFGIRGDNDAGAGHKPVDASMNHRWSNTETLPEFVWISLRDPLLAVLKK